MTCCTYYTDNEVRFYREDLERKDPEMHELLKEANAKGADCFVARREHEQPRFLRRPIKHATFKLLHNLKHGEYQIINFVPVKPDKIFTSFGFNAERSTVMNYLMGWRNGYDAAKSAERSVAQDRP